MTVKIGKAILRAALEEELIINLKIAAAKAKVTPNAVVDAALRLFLEDEKNLERIHKD